MPLPDTQIQMSFAAIGAFIQKRRPKPEIRHLLDIKAEIAGQEVIVSEIRPSFSNPAESREHPIAKAKWIGTQNRWRLYWMRADLKWHLYEPGSHLIDIQSIINEVDRDPHGCFWG